MRRLIAPLLATALLLSSVGTVSADSTYRLEPVACAFFMGGSITVEPGSELILRSGWTATTKGQIVSFMHASTWLVTVDGIAIDVTPNLEVSQLDRRLWAVLWEYPVGTIGLGDMIDVTLDIELSHPNFDGSFLYPAGSVFGGPVECLVTGAPTPEE